MNNEEEKKSLSINWKMQDQSGFARLCYQNIEPQSSMAKEESFMFFSS